MKLFKKAKKGFTLVELVVVIAVIAILSAVSVGAYFGITASANNSAAEQEGKAFHTNLVLLANTPKNGFCTINSKGLTIDAAKNAEKVVEEVARIGGVDYSGYVITFTQDSANPADTELDYISFKHSNGVTVVLDVVTGEKISTTAAA